MSAQYKFKQADFSSLWFDVNALNKNDWDQIMSIAKNIESHNIFNKSPLKCIVTAFVLFVSKENQKKVRGSEWVH